MNQPTNESEQRDPAVADDDLRALLNNVDLRPEPSPAVQQRAYAELRGEWQSKVTSHRQQRQRRMLTWLSAAAGVAVVALIGLLGPFASDPSWPVTVADGTLVFEGTPRHKMEALAVRNDQRMTADTAVRLETARQTDLRLASGSQLRWLSETEAYLLSGSAYVDTRNVSDFSIHTTFGQVKDIGTRYMVTLTADSMSVAVREGAAIVDSAYGSSEARAEALTTAVIHIDQAGMREREEPASAPRWDWIHVVSTGYQEQTVPEVLTAIARDMGKSMSFRSRGVEATVANATVQGNLNNLAPHRALELVARSAGLSWEETEHSVTLDFNNQQ